MIKPRLLNAFIFAACAGLLGFGYYLQYHEGLDPCPLCIFQRACYFGAGVITLIAAVHNPAQPGTRIYGALTSLTALGGGIFAGRQVWLQHLPKSEVPECGPGLEYWVKTLPIAETVKRVFRGTGDCAEVDWTFLKLSIAEWSLICFALILLATALFLVFRPARR
ncbi:MAG TPA: disulfide bond formation protein B [Gammaproteobacteria bacterium]|nr:disulfide bond formation protein B [Gammaproteobacteria bacterium]